MPSGVLFLLLLCLIALPIGRAVARYLDAAADRRALPPGPAPEEWRRLREEVRLLAERVDRIRDDTDFLTRLLEERPPRTAIANRGNDDR